MSDHEHHAHDPDHGHGHETAIPEGQDAGTQALAEALRSSFLIVKIVMVLMIVAFFCSGFFTVGASERAVILRFGKTVGGEKALLGPGWHWSFPYPIDEVVRITNSAEQSVETTVGWYYTTPGEDLNDLTGENLPVTQELNPAVDGYVITADQDIVHSRATLYYHLNDPIAYTFDFSNAQLIVQNALNNALLFAAANFKADDILLDHVTEFTEAVQKRATDLTDQYHLGITVDDCTVQSIPPRQLAGVFAAVTDARETSAKAIYQANSDATATQLNAGAEASARTNQAMVASTTYVSLVEADAKRFNELLPEYRTNAALFEQQQINVMMAQVLTNVGDKWFIPESANGKTSQLRLQLNPEPPAPPTEGENQ
ncbi:MAG TPA: protease modulator HflK [Verrucomicrobiae bacterium]|nr:protease modulator HflK [Verrucomicrobiae bacterium]